MKETKSALLAQRWMSVFHHSRNRVLEVVCPCSSLSADWKSVELRSESSFLLLSRLSSTAAFTENCYCCSFCHPHSLLLLLLLLVHFTLAQVFGGGGGGVLTRQQRVCCCCCCAGLFRNSVSGLRSRNGGRRALYSLKRRRRRRPLEVPQMKM